MSTWTPNTISQAALPASNTTLYTAPASTVAHIQSLIFSNVSANSVTFTAQIVRSGGTPIVSIVTNAPIPVGGALDIVQNKSITLKTGDAIRAIASAASSIDVSGSVMEQT